MQQERFRDMVLDIADRRGISLREIARQMGINHSQVSRHINGITSFSREWLISLCKVLECTDQQAIEIFKQTDYRAPTQEELDEHPSLLATA